MTEFLTPPQVAKRLRVSPEKVIHWIRTGKLAGINIAESALRPRFRVSAESLEAFEVARAVIPPTKTPRRPKRKLTYF